LSPFSWWLIKVVIIITAETFACPFMWKKKRVAGCFQATLNTRHSSLMAWLMARRHDNGLLFRKGREGPWSSSPLLIVMNGGNKF
jgi:hypothetical protein